LRRRDFIRIAAGTLGAVSVAGCARKTGEQQEQAAIPAPPEKPQAGATQAAGGKVGKNRHDPHPIQGLDAVIAKGSNPAAMLDAGLQPFGGIEAFVHRGDTVIVKPNLAWSRMPEQAACTQPVVLVAVVKACLAAGAGEVLVVEHPCDRSIVTFDISGAQEALQAIKIPLIALESEQFYSQVEVSQGVNIRDEQIAQDILDCDCYINLPIGKVHSATGVTLALKNQLGAVWRPQRYHESKSEEEGGENLHQNIADLSTALRPTLNIIDCTRVLTTNGPKGPGKVEQASALVISPDIVAADVAACEFLPVQPSQVAHFQLAAAAGVGRQDNVQIKRVQASA